MTGSRSTGPLQPPENLSPLPPWFRESDNGHCRHSHRNMTPVVSAGQPIQLTPLWEHVVRTQKFPTEVDVRSTFLEISERLRDPEWEVRQHALRVLVDVLPTLDIDVMDKVMQPVVPELINNLGHSAPAIRKGALDTLRVYVLNSRDRDSTVQRILHEGLHRCAVHDVFQTNVTTGVILSAPSLLFPSSSSPRPSASIVREVIVALASRLVQVTHQEAVVRSLVKIRDAVGREEFESDVRGYDPGVLKHLEVLAEVYDVKTRARSPRKRRSARKKREKADGKWDSDSDTSGIVEEEDEGGAMPPARVVLETEIKFNEETAITMTILEEKNDGSEAEDDDDDEDEDESGTDLKNDDEKIADVESPNDRRSTPRRVHFGGEVVKLRTPDSDETESVGPTTKTRIPLPVTPATKLPPKGLRRRSCSQPEMGKDVASPALSRGRARRKSRSVSNSPKKERYVHNANVSPKKGILSRTNSPVFVIKPVENYGSSGKTGKITSEKVDDDDEAKSKDQSGTNGGSDGKGTTRTSRISPSQIERRNAKEEAGTARSGNPREPTNTPVPDKSSVVEATARSSESEPRRKQDDGAKSSSEPEPKVLAQQSSLSGKSGEGKDVAENVGRSRTADGNGARKKSATSANEKSQCDSVFGSLVDDEVHEDARGEGGAFEVETSFESTGDGDVNANTRRSSEMDGVEEETLVNSKSERNPERNSARRSRGWVPSADCNKGRRSPSNDTRDNGSVGAMKSPAENNVTCSSSESEDKCPEPSWEELGLVSQEVLNDLHNKEDWRARVRGLERVASALRTPAALLAVEPRLGSLLHTALGGERSCRVAAAGLTLAKVVVTGVGEAALRRRLPQLAWGLARQGGPNAAQLARVAMLRLKPALFLEQLLQPQCLGARNAKTRENTLQLLIFSLVTFPSTEFTVDSVASRVVAMVGDRRRRVRQAALDTLAVLAQIYDPEEVLEAGKKAAKARHDGESMFAAIRARLARKSLPLVSADGLVVYGLQISPTVQIVTGPDVDWIVAGSGSVSPGTGRTRGQIIATSANYENDKRFSGDPWTNPSNLMALGVGLRPKGEPPVAWQIVPRQSQDDFHSRDDLQDNENSNDTCDAGGNLDADLNTEGINSRFYASPKRTYRVVDANGVNYEENVVNSFQRNRQDYKSNEFYSQNNVNYRTESRIPILNSRGTTSKLGGQGRDKLMSLGSINESSRKGTKDAEDNNGNERYHQEDNAGFRNMYQRRKQLHQENNGNVVGGVEMSSESLESSFGSYRPHIYTKSVDKNPRERRDDLFTDSTTQNYQRVVDNERLSKSPDARVSNTRPGTIQSHHQTPSWNSQQAVSNHDAYKSFYPHQRRNQAVYETPQTAPGPLTRVYQRYQTPRTRNDRNSFVKLGSERGMRDASSQKVTEIEQVSADAQTNGHPYLAGDEQSPFRRRLRSLSPSQLYHRDQLRRLTISRSQATSMHDIDKTAVNEEQLEERNDDRYSPQTDTYQIRPLVADEDRLGDEDAVAESNSSSSSEVPFAAETVQSSRVAGEIQPGYDNSDSGSSTAQSENTDKAFDVITSGHSSPTRNIAEPTVIRLNAKNDVPGSAVASIGEAMSKEWSSEDEPRRVEKTSDSPDRVDFRGSRENDDDDDDDDDDDVDTDDTFEAAAQEGGEARLRGSLVSVHSLTERARTPNATTSPKYHDKAKFPERSQGSPEKTCQAVMEYPENAGRIVSPTRRKSLSSVERESDTSDERIVTTVMPDDNVSFHQLNDEERPEEVVTDSNHSNETAESETKENFTHNTSRVHTESSANENAEKARPVKDVAFSTIPTHPPPLQVVQTRRLPSRVPRSTVRKRSNSNKAQRKTEGSTERTKSMVQQCFAQLESKDWEITIKGLKSLSQIARQHPEYLDLCMAGTVSRLLGRHVKNLRSQVARAACTSAADLFSAQIRGVDQDLDDIAGPLLHRTADTNRFLRADCNAALDKMAEHLPPHKTIAVVVHRGASHQNAIVRAATARLLSLVVDRIGPDHAMILPRDVREKLIATGAKLLIDGNLDARNHAKKMFRRLTRCEGFRKALTDSVSDSTLRNIDKTLKSL